MMDRLTPRDSLLLTVVVLCVAALHVSAFGNRYVADDAWFVAALDSRSLLEFLVWRYQVWSGRVPIEAGVVLLVSHPWLWKLCNSLIWLLFCYAAGRVSLSRTTVSPVASTAIAFAMLMLIAPEVLHSAAWWMTGSVNYLWPMALGLYGMLAWVGDGKGGNVVRGSYLVAGGLAMYNEQVALALLPAAAALLYARIAKARLLRWDVAQFGFMVINAIVVFAAPGSQRRFLSEQALRFPDFSSLGVIDKANIGVGLVLEGLIDPSNWMIAVAIVLSAALLLRSPAGFGTKLLILGMLVYLFLNYLLAIPFFDAPGLNELYSLPPLNGATASSSRAYALAAWSVFALMCLVAAMVTAFWKSPAHALGSCATLALGLGSLLAIGFSPTAYASGPRIHFVCQTALLLVTIRLVAQVRDQLGPRVFVLTTVCIAAGAAYRILSLLI